MRIHNYGNDYAYQQEQKSRENREAQVKEEKPAVPVPEPKEEVKDAENRILTEGQGEVAENGAQEAGNCGDTGERREAGEEKPAEEKEETGKKKKKQ